MKRGFERIRHFFPPRAPFLRLVINNHYVKLVSDEMLGFLLRVGREPSS